jgi:hypothetical protein
MKSDFDALTIIAIAIAAFFVFLAPFAYFRYRAQIKHLEQVSKDNLALQEFCISKMDALKGLLEDKTSPPEELLRRADDILDELEARNSNGRLDDLIADNRSYIIEQAGKRLA